MQTDIHLTNITSPVGPIFLAVLREMSASAEGAVFIDAARKQVLQQACAHALLKASAGTWILAESRAATLAAIFAS